MLDTLPREDGHEYGMGVVRYPLPGESPVYGHRGGYPGYECIAVRSAAGRAVVLYTNALDVSEPQLIDTAFVRAAFDG